MSIQDAQTGEIIETLPTVIDPVVMPAVTAEKALQAWNAYQELKRKVLTHEDHQEIQGKQYTKRSGWRKLANFFNLTVECVKEERTNESDSSITYEVTYRATAPNGRAVTGDGVYNSHERKKKDGRIDIQSIHNTRAQAHTRAFNRSVSNLIGGGEVSADEMVPDVRETKAIPSLKETKATPSVFKKEFKTVSAKQAARFVGKAISSGMTEPMWKNLLAKYNYKDPAEIEPKYYEELCDLADKKGTMIHRPKDDEPPPITDEEIAGSWDSLGKHR